MSRWRRADLRDYVRAALAALEERDPPTVDRQAERHRLRWALEYADRLDPLRSRAVRRSRLAIRTRSGNLGSSQWRVASRLAAGPCHRPHLALALARRDRDPLCRSRTRPRGLARHATRPGFVAPEAHWRKPCGVARS